MKANPVFDGLTAVRHGLELSRCELPAHRATAEQAALLVLPDHDLERMARDDRMFGQRLRDLDRGGGSDLSVVVAAAGDRIDVRPEQQRVERRVASGATADDVPREVDARLELRGSHPLHDLRARRLVGVAVRHARHAALWVLAESAERGEVRADALGVDMKVGLKRVDRETGRPVDRQTVGQMAEKRCGRAAQRDGVEIASVHEGGTWRALAKVMDWMRAAKLEPSDRLRRQHHRPRAGK